MNTKIRLYGHCRWINKLIETVEKYTKQTDTADLYTMYSRNIYTADRLNPQIDTKARKMLQILQIDIVGRQIDTEYRGKLNIDRYIVQNKRYTTT